MARIRRLTVLVLWVFFLWIHSTGAESRPTWFSNCQITEPNGTAPPGGLTDPNMLGNGSLWVRLWDEGTVFFKKGGSGKIFSDGSMQMKFPWWRAAQGKLSIEGRRLDADAPPLSAKIPLGYGEIGFQASGILFPTEGCWEVTGKVGNASLTFVTRVIRIEEQRESDLSAP